MTRFAIIEKAYHDVAALCRLLRVSRSGTYAWLSRPPSARVVADEVLTVQIRTAYDDNRRVYGAAADPCRARRERRAGGA